MKKTAGLVVSAALAATAVAQQQAPRVLRNEVRVDQGRIAIEELVESPMNAPARPGRYEPFAEPMTAAKIRRAVDDAIQFLRSSQMADGSLAGQDGDTALGVLAMLAAGADPASDEPLRRALDWLARRDVNNTYVRGIRANVWEYALRKVPYDDGLRATLKVDYEWLMKALGNKECWRYQMESADWDNSCSQYGVLGIWAAARAGFEPPDSFWVSMSKHFREFQNRDGGWGYVAGSQSTPNMATAGLASMFLVFDKYHGRSSYSTESPRTFSSGPAAQCLESIDRGMKWLGNAGLANNDAYFLYGIERVGVASGRKYIGGKDWFREGALAVLKSQVGSGMMSLSGHGDSIAHTAFAALFLVYGGAPVAFNKLEYGDGQDWNLNPRDLANLTKHLWSAYEQPLNWHSVNIGAPASEFEAPILFISGSRAAAFTDEDAAKLRDYVLRGGTILAEPSDKSAEFRDSMTALLGRMFPAADYPSCQLAPLPADHGLFTVLKQSWGKRPGILGASDGTRVFFMVSQDYLSADWQMDKSESDAFKLGMNLLFYATDMSVLQGKYGSVVPDTPPAPERKTAATVARIRHRGNGSHPTDWTMGAFAWTRMAPYLQHVTGMKLEQRDPVSLDAPVPAGIHLLHITGAHALKLTDAERAVLKAYAEGGGTVLVDAFAGSGDFAASARSEIEKAFGPMAPLDPRSTIASGRVLGGSDLTRGLKLKLAARRSMRQHGGNTQGQNLEAIMIGSRPAVIFSALDLSAGMAGIECFGCAGYKPESARKIAANILAAVAAD